MKDKIRIPGQDKSKGPAVRFGYVPPKVKPSKEDPYIRAPRFVLPYGYISRAMRMGDAEQYIEEVR